MTALEAEAALLRAALGASANAIAITDRAGTIEWVNEAFCTLTQYTAAEAVGRNPRDLVRSGQHDPAFYRDLWDTIRAGRVWRGDMVNRRKDGSLYDEEQVITPVRDAQGDVTHFIAVKQDVTERNRATREIVTRARLATLQAAVGLSLTKADSLDEALQQCAEALVTHLDAALARIWILDAATGVLELRASAGLYTHLDGRHGRVPLGELKIGRIAQDRTPHLTNAVIGDPHVHDQAWALQEGMVGFAGHPLIVKDRALGVMALFARQALPDLTMAALESVADHVSLGVERHQSRQALRAAEERVRFALQSANVGIWDLNYTTGALQWSETLEAHYGLRPGTFGRTFESFIACVHPDDRAAVLETMHQAVDAGADFQLENRAIWPDGTVRWLKGAGRILRGAHGEPIRALGISLDVTEQHSLEAQYRHAQKMEAVGRLAGGIAHDFNNLLGVILGSSELLLDDLAPGDPRRVDVTEIRKAGERAAGLTRQLLAFSRKEIVAPTLLDLNAVLADIQPMLGRLIGEDVTVVFALACEPTPVYVDRGQIEQVVMNLSVNARDAMPLGGTLTIETANVVLDEDYLKTHVGPARGRFVALVVSDTGTGMTPETQARLFEPFFTTKELGKGTGLGLATVHGIVTASGGTIAVYSEEGVGSSFKAFFPCADGAGAAVEGPPPGPSPGAAPGTVLLVEDADGLRDVTMKLLQREGYTVLAAANADDALAVFDGHPAIDVVVTDVVMPGRSGPELVKQLVARRPGLKVIFMSGYTAEATVRHGLLAPGTAFLNKPLTSAALVRTIRQVLAR